ncbi:transglutaminase-like domain-containing protein [Clostridium sp. D53t1_180928_C8]|uniref:transglutaminase-like domain-containing protein n=1 Tax=Clostridium sp. D53t1_180928_C8 TaxID=2787101 RepID=UPI0018AB799A|nr:transglutaminase-like domain-containing protein [Clostridium sp. D53t1_180928_C8]
MVISSQELIKSVSEKFNKTIMLLSELGEEIRSKLQGLNENQRILMEFVYSNMPISDAVDYEFDLFLEFVNHGIFLRENISWCKELEDKIFLTYILDYRVNDEGIEACRRKFFDLIFPRIENKEILEVIIETNYWCAENGTYSLTDDRTISALGFYNSGFGRCGEESVFVTNVFRSIGIPARQIYAPKWAHCDDNHAWVEVYVNGSWKFLGACEPEPILNRGWFTNASSRAMLVHSKVYNDTIKDNIIEKEGAVTFINNTLSYALGRVFTIEVINENNNPIKDVKIEVQLLNMSYFQSVATLHINNEGQAQLALGYGDILLSVSRGNSLKEVIVSTKENEKVTVVLDKENKIYDNWNQINLKVPKDYPMHFSKLEDEEKEENFKRIKRAKEIREERVNKEYKEELYKNLKDIEDTLKESKGNIKEIVKFLEIGDNLGLRKKIVLSLNNKDLRDIKAKVLEEALNYSMKYKEIYNEDVFINYIVSPRAYNENLSCYREYIESYFSIEEKKKLKSDIKLVWSYIENKISSCEEREYRALYTTPVGVLKLRKANLISKKILFIAICRTLGIATRLNPIDKELEYYINGKFKKVISGDEKQGKVKLLNLENKWTYFNNITISKLINNSYEVLDLSKINWNEKCIELSLKEGEYKIITSNRSLNGNLFAYEYCFKIKEYEEKEIKLRLRYIAIKDMIESNKLEEFKVYDKENNVVLGSELTKNEVNILIWLEEGQEPSEHILNEVLQNISEFKKIDSKIKFIVKDKYAFNNKTFKNVINLLENKEIYYDDFTENVETIARRMYVDSDKLPLVLMTNKSLNGIYASSGYNVGLGELLINVYNNI